MHTKQESSHHTQNQATKINSGGVGIWRRGQLVYVARQKPGRKAATTLKARQEVPTTLKTRQESGHCMQTSQESSHPIQNQATQINSGGLPSERGVD